MGVQKRRTGLKILLGFVGFLFLAIAVLLLVQWIRYLRDPDPYKTFLIPRLEFSAFEIGDLDLDKTTLTGSMLVHNPLPINLRADSLQYTVFIDSHEVIKSTYAKSINIKHWDSTWITLPITAYSDKLLTILTNAENAGKDSVVYEVKTSFGTNIILHKQFNLDIAKLLPLIYIPKIKVDKIVYDSLNLEGVTLIIHTTIVNKNQFPLNFKDLTFQFALADNPWVKGTVPGTIEIPDSSVVPLAVPLRISFKQMGKSIGPLIKSGKQTDYKFNLNLKLVSESNAIKNSKVILKDEGTIKEIVRLAKEEVAETKEKKKEAEKNGDKPDKKDKPKIKIEKKK